METWIRRACRQRAYRKLWLWGIITISIVAGLSLPFLTPAAESYSVSGSVLWMLAITYFGALWLFAWPAWQHTRNIALHPVVKWIEGWSNAADVAAISEREMRTSVQFKKLGMSITDSFIVQHGYLNFNLFPIQDLLWSYKKVTTRSINFIPMARTSEAVFIFYGGSVSFPARKQVVEDVLLFVANRAPWAFFGYSDGLLKLYKKTPAQFCAAVQERQRALG